MQPFPSDRNTIDKSDMADVKLDKKQVLKAVKALREYVKKKQEKDLVSLIDTEDINIQIGFQKVPEVKNKIIKIPLPHKITDENSEVCLFVKDIDKKKRDYQLTLDHYEELLKINGITGISKIIPLKQVKLEYQPYEAKRNLSNMFDTFLVDDRIARLLPGLLGKNFYGRKRFPRQVKLTAKNLKTEVNKVLSQAQYIISGRGATSQVTISRTDMKDKDIVENVMAAVNRLKDSIPGGANNVKTISLKTHDSPSLPVFVTTDSPNDTKLPPPQAAEALDEPEEITTVMGAKVRVTKGGRIQIFKDASEAEDKKKSSDGEDETDNSDDDAENSDSDDDNSEEEGSNDEEEIDEDEEGSEENSDDDDDDGEEEQDPSSDEEEIPTEPQPKKRKGKASTLPKPNTKEKSGPKTSKPNANRKRKASR